MMIELRWIELPYPVVANIFGQPIRDLQYRDVIERDENGNAVTATPWVTVPVVKVA